MRRKGCQRKWKARNVRQTTHASRTKSNTQRKWVHRSSNALRLPRETEKRLQIWDSNQFPSESHLAEGGVLNTLLIFESIPNDETYKDEQYVQGIAEQVPTLVNTKRI